MGSAIKTVSVVGPTASGKSSLGIVIAQALDGEILNVDSVQVYRELDIGSAKVPEHERGGVPHHLLDLRAPNDLLNVGTFREYAMDALRDICIPVIPRFGHLFAKTVWVNLSSDKHRTLDRTKYSNPGRP